MNTLYLEQAASERHEDLLREAAQHRLVVHAQRAAREQNTRQARIERLRRQADASRDRLIALEQRRAAAPSPWLRLGRALRLVGSATSAVHA